MHLLLLICNWLIPSFFFSLFFLRLESQLVSDIQTILQLLQRQPTLGPPAYSTVTASPDYHRPAVKVQPVALTASHFFSHTGTQVRIFKRSFLAKWSLVCMYSMVWSIAFFLAEHRSHASADCWNHHIHIHHFHTSSSVMFKDKMRQALYSDKIPLFLNTAAARYALLHTVTDECLNWLECLPQHVPESLDNHKKVSEPSEAVYLW